jgi:hypothetical protein
MDLHAASCAAADAVAQIHVKIKTKLLQRALRHGMTEAEAIELAEAWNCAARHTRHLPFGDLRKGR